ncbi:MAG: tRNA uridine-5-carboxymethylaminomethyl(34) synthesis GTPase MnmE, partial [Pseudomonadota bacterium]
MDTIVALSSGALPAGVAVIRLSGPEAFSLAARIAKIDAAVAWKLDRKARLVKVHDPRNDEVLDHGLLLAFEGPRSFTGEDVVELQLHGSRAVVDHLLAALSEVEGVRIAEPGEFTRRAFINGKMDLIATEALGDLIQAQTQAQRRLAISSADGKLIETYRRWRDMVLRGRAMIEADIDFADEDDVPGSVVDAVFADIPTLVSEINGEIKKAETAERVREGFRIVIFGPPNAGKSTLLNALAGREAAIVTDIPGTTRDAIEVQLNLGGFLVRIVDTAGVRATSDPIEKIGVERALDAAIQADLVLNLSADDKWESPSGLGGGKTEEPTVLRVRSQVDVYDSVVFEDGALPVSAITGEGLEELIESVVSIIGSKAGALNERAAGNRRHISKMVAAASHLQRIDTGLPLEINAERLRLAGLELSELVGDIGHEE